MVQINEAVTKRAAAKLEHDAAKPDSAAASKAEQLVEYYATKVEGLEKAKTSTLPCEFDFSAEVWRQLHCHVAGGKLAVVYQVIASAENKISTALKGLTSQLEAAQTRLEEFRSRPVSLIQRLIEAGVLLTGAESKLRCGWQRNSIWLPNRQQLLS